MKKIFIKTVFSVLIFFSNLNARFEILKPDSLLMQEILYEVSDFSQAISKKLDSKELFLSGLVDMHLLLEFDKKLESELISNWFERLLKKALKKINNKEFNIFREQVEAISSFYQKAKNKNLENVVLTYLPEFDLFLKNISLQVVNEKTLLEGLKDLYLILEHDLVVSDESVRLKIVKEIKKAFQMANYLDFNFYQGFVLEVLDKALNMKVSDSFVFPQTSQSRLKIISIKNSFEKEGQRAEKREKEREDSLKKEIEDFNNKAQGLKRARRDKSFVSPALEREKKISTKQAENIKLRKRSSSRKAALKKAKQARKTRKGSTQSLKIRTNAEQAYQKPKKKRTSKKKEAAEEAEKVELVQEAQKVLDPEIQSEKVEQEKPLPEENKKERVKKKRKKNLKVKKETVTASTQKIRVKKKVKNDVQSSMQESSLKEKNQTVNVSSVSAQMRSKK